MVERVYHGKVGLQQRVLPAYRAPFFDALAQACTGGLSVLAGQPLPGENIAHVEHLQVARYVPVSNYHLLDPSSSLYQCWQGGVQRWLENWQPDVLILEANPRYLSNRSAICWMHARQRPVLGWGLGAPPIRGGNLLKRLFLRWRLRSRSIFLKSFDGWIAYSRRGAEEYRALGLPPERIFTAFNAVTPRPKAPIPPRPRVFTSAPVVLFVGRLQARKRVDLLLHACSALPPELQPRLVIVGDGPSKSELQGLAAGLFPSAEFTGEQHGVELEQYFQAADLFVLPGTGGLAVQQAMAFGLPVIVAAGDGTQDDLVRPANGWQVPPNDVNALTNVLHTALADAQQLRRMGNESYRIVVEEVNLEVMVSVFIQALTSTFSAGVVSAVN